MSSLKPEIIREIGFRLLSENSDRFLSTAVQNFMLASKEGFDVVLQAFRQTTFVYIEPEGYVETRLALKKRNIRLYLQTGNWYFKVLAEVAVSSAKELHFFGVSSNNVLPIIKSINKEVELIKITGSCRLNKLFEAFNGISNVVVEKVDIRLLLHERGFLKEDLRLFSVPCRTLILSNVYWEKSRDFGDWNNKCLHQVRHLTLKGDSRFGSNKIIKNLMTFISVNFLELETLKVDFKIQYDRGCSNWNWNDSELPEFVNTLFPSVKGSIKFLIVNSARRHPQINNNIPGVHHRYDHYHHCSCYFKNFPIHDNLTLKLALRN